MSSSANTFRFRPPSFYRLGLEELRLELDQHLPRLYDAHNALVGQVIKAPAINGGFGVQSGTVTVTGSKLGIATGLTTVTRVVASLDAANGTPTNFTVAAQPSQGTKGAVDIYVFMPTSASVTTAIAATTAAVVHWWATGVST